MRTTHWIYSARQGKGLPHDDALKPAYRTLFFPKSQEMPEHRDLQRMMTDEVVYDSGYQQLNMDASKFESQSITPSDKVIPTNHVMLRRC